MGTEYNEEVIQYKDNTPLKVQAPKSLILMGWFAVLFFVALLLFPFIMMLREEESSLLFTVVIGVIGFCPISVFICMVVAAARRKLVLLEDHFEYTPSFGKTRNFSYSDLQKISLSRAYVLYDCQGKRLTVFSGLETNADAAVEFFRAKGVPTDF